MSQFTILVIDDSATIRRLVDSTLTQSGYRVLLAPTAEEGIEKAETMQPDMILLDHQLPGTTGYEVCLKLHRGPAASIPVVVSSTLRKKAYAEYTELSNVVDMLPKPYSEELLKTTVANALETGRLVVESQSQGTAVPEVIGELAETQLSGNFEIFRLREVLDLLNNGRKSGVLEVESREGRVWFYLEEGRVQAALASGIDVQLVAESLPETLASLAPILRMTMAGRSCSELDGMVELLDRKVLDPRLLRMLLRHQASLLIWHCFSGELLRFRFEAGVAAPAMFRRLALDVSLTALLIDASLKVAEEPQLQAGQQFVRRALRGQNLDRSGLSAQQMQLLGGLTSAQSIAQLSIRSGLTESVVARVLRGLILAELVEQTSAEGAREIVVMDQEPSALPALRTVFAARRDDWIPRFVKDAQSLKILLKRRRVDAVIVPLDSLDAIGEVDAVQQVLVDAGAPPCICVEDGQSIDFDDSIAAVTLQRPYGAEQLARAIVQALASRVDGESRLVGATASSTGSGGEQP